MPYPDQYGIIANFDLLSEEYIPENIPGRESQIKGLRFCLEPISKRRRPLNTWLYGPPGTGKTATSRLVLRQITQAYKVYGVYVNCWERNSLYGVLEKIITELRILGAEKPDSSFKIERLQRHLKDTSLILVLDEIDQPPPKERNSILYNLCGLENVGLICICNSRYFLFGLDERIKSRLNVTQIEFQPYSVADLAYILSLRAETALVPRTWDKGVLEAISEKADGDARIAIQTLKNSAYYAEKSNSPKILPEHVEKGWKDAKVIKKTYLLNKLTTDHRILFEIIKSKKEILSNELWEAYLTEAAKRGRQPIALRTYSEYMNKLRDLGLIQADRARVRGKVRVFRVVE
ncbi:AAA family ATPase [bacterium]|nr:AAA family ATPase [bacterium]